LNKRHEKKIPGAQTNLAAKELAEALRFVRGHRGSCLSPRERAILNGIYYRVKRAHIFLTADDDQLERSLSEARNRPLYTDEELLEHAQISEAEKAAMLKMPKR